jgi:hypothetical protein
MSPPRAQGGGRGGAAVPARRAGTAASIWHEGFSGKTLKEFHLAARRNLVGVQGTPHEVSLRVQNSAVQPEYLRRLRTVQGHMHDWFRAAGTSMEEAAAEGTLNQGLTEYLSQGLQQGRWVGSSVRTLARQLDGVLYRMALPSFQGSLEGKLFLRGLGHLGLTTPQERKVPEASALEAGMRSVVGALPREGLAAEWLHRNLGWRPSELERFRGVLDLAWDRSHWWVQRFLKTDPLREGLWECLPPVPPWLDTWFQEVSAAPPTYWWGSYSEQLRRCCSHPPVGTDIDAVRAVEAVRSNVRTARTVLSRRGIQKEPTMDVLGHQREATTRLYNPRPWWRLR